MSPSILDQKVRLGRKVHISTNKWYDNVQSGSSTHTSRERRQPHLNRPHHDNTATTETKGCGEMGAVHQSQPRPTQVILLYPRAWAVSSR